MSRWGTQRKPWNKAPGWRSEPPDEQKGSLAMQRTIGRLLISPLGSGNGGHSHPQ